MGYVREFGSITPSRLSDIDRRFQGGFLGAETRRRCYELVELGKLVQTKEGKYVRFLLAEPSQTSMFGYYGGRA